MSGSEGSVFDCSTGDGAQLTVENGQPGDLLFVADDGYSEEVVIALDVGAVAELVVRLQAFLRENAQ